MSNRTETAEKIRELLTVLYKEEAGGACEAVSDLIGFWKKKASTAPAKPWVNQDDVMLITYGDSIREHGDVGLRTLKKFLDSFVHDRITAVHLLPMYPSTSDDGFSVADYYRIDPSLGDWEQVEALSQSYDLMFDAVINHVSRSSGWFRSFLEGDPAYRDYFIVSDPSADYSKVTRPRTLPLLTAFQTAEGRKHLWTTFSDDQIDLNFRNPRVMTEVLSVLCSYASRGARFIRLDAVGFAWKEPGTTCMHLRETHALVKLMRAVLDEVFPGTLIITETNVPHADNISYFGNGSDEAHLVYQFPLPPLVLFSLLTGNAEKLSAWAGSIGVTSSRTTYFNFLSSHDGIGLRPVEGILSGSEKDLLVDSVVRHGGKISYRDNSDGTRTPYELNITYMDALTDPSSPDDEVRIARFLAAHSILLAVAGVPGIYIHSLLGSRNWYEGVESSGVNRRINREKLEYSRLKRDLESPESFRSRVLSRFSSLIDQRRSHPAFSPDAEQAVRALDSRVFACLRTSRETGERILALTNVSSAAYDLRIEGSGTDIVSGERTGAGTVRMQPYQVRWIVLD